MQTEFPQSFIFPVPFNSPENPSSWIGNSSYLREFRESLIDNEREAEIQKSEANTKVILEMPFDLLYGNTGTANVVTSLDQVSTRENKDQKQLCLRELENSQARCSSQVSRSSSPKLAPLSVQQLQQVSKSRRKSKASYTKASGSLTSGCSKNSRTEWEIQTKVCIDLLVRAVEEDLGRSAKRCGNTYCEMIQQFGVKSETNERYIKDHKEWLCDKCVQAYDNNQYCQYCHQIYLDTGNESGALDGEEWAQCESSEDCERWVHVRCLAEKLGKPREIILAETFKYVCCNCDLKLTGKRRRPSYRYLFRTINSSNKNQRKNKRRKV